MIARRAKSSVPRGVGLEDNYQAWASKTSLKYHVRAAMGHLRCPIHHAYVYPTPRDAGTFALRAVPAFARGGATIASPRRGSQARYINEPGAVFRHDISNPARATKGGATVRDYTGAAVGATALAVDMERMN